MDETDHEADGEAPEIVEVPDTPLGVPADEEPVDPEEADESPGFPKGDPTEA